MRAPSTSPWLSEPPDLSKPYLVASWVEDLDAVQAAVYQLGDQGLRQIGSGVGKEGDSSYLVDQLDHSLRRRVGFGNKGRGAVPKIAVKGLFLAGHQAAIYQGCGDARPAQGTGAGLSEHLLQCHLQAQAVQTLDYGTSALVTMAVQEAQVIGQPRVFPLEAVGQDVDLALPDVGAELGTGNDLDVPPMAGFQRLVDAGNGVVIGEAQGLQPSAAGVLDGFGWRSKAVRAKRMDVKIGQVVTHESPLMLGI